LLEILDDNRHEVTSLVHLTKELILITYATKEEYIMENPSSNLAVSIFTTAYARLHLYEAMKKVHESGSTLAYADTGSILN